MPSSELRSWSAGDPEPLNVTRVNDRFGNKPWVKGSLGGWTADRADGPFPISWANMLNCYGPVVEVLPETPTPDRGCCTTCDGTGSARPVGEPCSDCRATGHPHDGPCPPTAPVSVVQDDTPACTETIAFVHVKETPTCHAWPIVERVPGGWQSGVHHYADEDVLEVMPVPVPKHVCDAELVAEIARLRAALGRTQG